MIADTSFTKHQKTGTNMFSRRGMLTAFEYPVFQLDDPVNFHEKYLSMMDKQKKTITAGIIPGKPPTLE